MNRKFALTLLSSPTLFASIISFVMVAQPATAGQNPVDNSLACARSPHSAVPRFVCERSHKQATTLASKPDFLVPQEFAPNQIGELQFTDEESDAAIALFGCDCPSCLNTLRQMRGMSEMAV